MRKKVKPAEIVALVMALAALIVMAVTVSILIFHGGVT